MNLDHLVMHGLAIKKHASPEAVAGILGLQPGQVQDALDGLVKGGRAVQAQGRYLLTPAARMALDSEYSRYYADLRANAEFKAGYEGFERINGELKALITDWQTIEIGGQRLPNDHSDRDHDGKIIDRLGELHERAETVIDLLARAMPRMSIYRDKLLAALERAEDGDIAWVSDPTIESYHTLWFEMHEDLLRLTGRERQE
jgi:hypothetical protein